MVCEEHEVIGEAKVRAIKGKQIASALSEKYGAKLTDTVVTHRNAYLRPNLKSAVEAMAELRTCEGGEECFIVVPQRLQNALWLVLSRRGFESKSFIDNEVIEELDLASTREREAFINELLEVREYYN
jgi:hypothetical protein